MATRRQIQTDSDEIRHLNEGDPAAALRLHRRKQAEIAEKETLHLFFGAHPELMSCEANAGILLTEARSYGAPVTAQLLEVALLKVASTLAATPPVAPPPPSPEELAVAERSRLLGLSLGELHAEVRQRDLKKRIPTDFLSEDVSALKTRADIQKLPASVLRRMVYRASDGSSRRLNTEYINKILQGNI